MPDGILAGGPAEKDEEGNDKPRKKPPKVKVWNEEEGIEEEQDLIMMRMMNMNNKFADLDPTHFRMAAITLEITYRGLSM